MVSTVNLAKFPPLQPKVPGPNQREQYTVHQPTSPPAFRDERSTSRLVLPHFVTTSRNGAIRHRDPIQTHNRLFVRLKIHGLSKENMAL